MTARNSSQSRTRVKQHFTDSRRDLKRRAVARDRNQLIRGIVPSVTVCQSSQTRRLPQHIAKRRIFGLLNKEISKLENNAPLAPVELRSLAACFIPRRGRI